MSHSCMMEEKDGKCYIDSRSSYARKLERQFREGHIPSFAELFSHTTCGSLTTEEKRGKHIIQMSFFIRGKRGEIMLMERVDPSHVITRGRGVLVSWSPCLASFSSGAPRSYRREEIADIFTREIDFCGAPAPVFRYVGMARNVPSPGRVYYFHLFEASYPVEEERLCDIMERIGSDRVFVKDKEQFCGFHAPSTILKEGWVENRVDSYVLQMLARGLTQPLWDEGHEGCGLIPWPGYAEGKDIPDFITETS